MNHNILENPGQTADLGANKNGAPGPGLTARIGPKKIRTKIFLLVTILVLAVSVFFLAYFPNRLERHLTLEIRS
ncbi:MAG: hypothetical protein ACXVJK_03865, partial [Candidatus Aminicenantales bacterium]